MDERNLTPMICNVKEITPAHTQLFNHLRQLSLRLFRRNVYRSFMGYMRRKYGLGYQAIYQLYNTNAKKGSKSLRRAFKSLLNNKERLEDFILDFTKGREAVERSLFSSYWDWEVGSSTFFWRVSTSYLSSTIIS